MLCSTVHRALTTAPRQPHATHAHSPHHPPTHKKKRSYKELKDYILARRDALGGKPVAATVASGSGGIMDLDADDDVAMGKVGGGKGFSS